MSFAAIGITVACRHHFDYEFCLLVAVNANELLTTLEHGKNEIWPMWMTATPRPQAGALKFRRKSHSNVASVTFISGMMRPWRTSEAPVPGGAVQGPGQEILEDRCAIKLWWIWRRRARDQVGEVQEPHRHLRCQPLGRGDRRRFCHCANGHGGNACWSPSCS